MAFETLDSGFNTDLAAFNPGAQFKQTSIGMRGQAIALAWAATVVLAIGLGWFASELYRAADKIAPIAANADADSAAPAGPAVPMMTAAPAGTQGAGVTEPRPNAPSDQVALNATGPAADNARENESAQARKTANRNDAARSDAARSDAARGEVARSDAARSNADAGGTALAQRDVVAPPSVASAPAPAPPPPVSIAADAKARVAEAKPVGAAATQSAAAPPPSTSGDVTIRGSRQNLVPRDAVSPGSAAGALANDTVLSARMLSDTSWRAISGDSARKALGGTVVRLHTSKVIGYSESAAAPQRIRMQQVTAAGDTIDIIQTRPKTGETISANGGAGVSVRGSMERSPALLARVVIEGETGRRYYETLKWGDERLVTIVAKDAATIRAVKDQLATERLER